MRSHMCFPPPNTISWKAVQEVPHGTAAATNTMGLHKDEEVDVWIRGAQDVWNPGHSPAFLG